MVSSALFHSSMNLLVFFSLHILLDHAFAWTTIFLPVVLLPLVLIALGMSWLLAALGVYLRDVAQVTGVLATAMLFMSTAMFPLDALPHNYRWLLKLNPLTFFIDQARDVTLWGRQPDWLGLALYAVGGMLVVYGGFAVFQLTRRGFADVI
jgi:lipopolysaccharide transport system permease protein